MIADSTDRGKKISVTGAITDRKLRFDFHETRRAAEIARSKGLKTKLDFTFRYSPGMRSLKELID